MKWLAPGPGMVADTLRVLLIDDDPADVARVEAALAVGGISTADIRVVPDSCAAAAALQSLTFDIVLLDLPGPEAGGSEAFEAIRQSAHGTPVVVLAGADAEPLALRAVHRGAQDYLVKDRMPPDQLMRSINCARARHRLHAENTRRLEHELELAALVQRAFLPAVVPAPAHQELGGYLHASKQIGGDFYDFIELDAHCVAIAVGDASGKGSAGAILMARAQGILRTEAAKGVAPLTLVHTLNRALCRDKAQDRFVTLFYGVLTTEDCRFGYVNAGHPAGILLGGAGLRELSSTGPPLGLFADATYEERAITIEAHERLVIYSDGVAEAQDDADRFFDRAGILAVMTAHPDASAPHLARLICEEAERFETDNADPGDDKTVVVIRALGP